MGNTAASFGGQPAADGTLSGDRKVLDTPHDMAREAGKPPDGVDGGGGGV